MVEEEFPQIDGYETFDSLGQGGTGKVYVVKDNTKKMFAMKIVSIEEGKKLVELHKSCTHESLIQIRKNIEKDGKMYLILDLVKSTLQNEIRKRREIVPQQPFTEEETRRYLKEIIQGSNRCRENNIELRDIKPDQIYIANDSDGIKLGNFGIMTIFQHERITGPPPIMYLDKISPDIYNLMNKRYEGTQIDIWRIGLIAYEMMTLDFPIKGISNIDITWETLEKYFNKYKPFDFTQLMNAPISKIFSKMIKDLLNISNQFYHRLICDFTGELEYDVPNALKEDIPLYLKKYGDKDFKDSTKMHHKNSKGSEEEGVKDSTKMHRKNSKGSEEECVKDSTKLRRKNTLGSEEEYVEGGLEGDTYLNDKFFDPESPPEGESSMLLNYSILPEFYNAFKRSSTRGGK